MKYNVHRFEVVRVMHEGIEAGSIEEAIDKTTDLTNVTLPAIINRHRDPEVECLLQTVGYIVDPILDTGEVDYEHTRFLDADMKDEDKTDHQEE